MSAVKKGTSRASTTGAPSSLSDEELRKLLKPAPSNDEVIQLVQKFFAKADDNNRVEIVKELDSYDDRNYWMKISGTDRLVKVHNGVESSDALKSIELGTRESVIHFQYGMMKILGEHGIQASCPIVPSSNDDDETPKVSMVIHDLPVVAESHSPCKLVVSVYNWVPGMTMSSMKVLPIECIADAGRFLGNLHQKLDSKMSADDFPASKRYHQWDGKNTKDLSKFVHYIPNEGRRNLVKSIISKFDTDLIQSGIAAANFRKGIIHGDYNDANILLDESFTVIGVIDFGDSVESWTVLDVSVAMAYCMLTPYGKLGRSMSAAAAFLRGFHSVFPLTETEREHLVLLIACRLACSVTLGAYSYQQNPANKYLLLHSEPAWAALELIWGEGDPSKREKVGDALNLLFEMACEPAANNDCQDSVINCSNLAVPDEYIPQLLDSIAQKKKDGSVSEQPAKRQKVSPEQVITFVTGNKKKLEEVQRILFDDSKLNLTLTNAKIDLPELQGDPLSIAKEKCEVAAKAINGAVITEDTSLCFTALNELPGPYIKWFLEKCGHDGLNKMIEAFDDKSGYAQTVVAFCEGPGKQVFIFDGRTTGKIVGPRGKLDFGWDPIFEPCDGQGKTYAEMSKEEKDSISHRSRAFAKLKAFLIENSK